MGSSSTKYKSSEASDFKISVIVFVFEGRY